ncbi:MAG: lysylphosphatidylglycerol synthase transmembrane domain-containing protein [Anaerolineae bacterium]|nr:lysylphosphatidylglycerol synthase transmembrane domain-containing protein [Anaerolineae bacterium]
MTKRANLVRGILLLLMAAFFGYRYALLDSSFYLSYISVLLIVGLLTLADVIAKRWQTLVFNIGIALVFLDLAFAQINLAEAAQALTSANYWMMIPATLFVLIHLYFRTLRSQWLLKPMGKVGFWPAYRALVIGIAGNTVLPARAGEFLRAYVLGRSTGLSKTGAFATIVVERIFDGLTVLLFLLVVIIFGVRDERFQLFGAIGAAVYLGILAGLIVFMTRREWIDSLIKQRLPEDLATIVLELLDGFGSGLAILKNPGQLGMVTFWNMLTWLTVPVSFWFVLRAFDFGDPVPWQAPVLMLPALGIVLSVPGPPGGVGLFHSAAAFTLELTYANLNQVPDFLEVAAAASILLHISQFGPELIIGAISFVYEGLSTDDLKAGQKIQVEPERIAG